MYLTLRMELICRYRKSIVEITIALELINIQVL